MKTRVALSVTVLSLTLLAAPARAQLFPTGAQGPQNPHGPRTIMVLMNDGSVRTIVVGGGQQGGIDPRVLSQIRGSGREGDGHGIMPGMEFRPSPTRPGIPAPVNTWDGLDEQVRRLWNMEQNWRSGTGPMMYSYQAIVIRDPRMTAQQMYQRLRTFELFDPAPSTTTGTRANVAEVQLVRARGDVDPRWTGRQWALFRAKPEYPGIVGTMNGLQTMVNSRWVPVELFYDDREMHITAATLGDHMIVGARRWAVRPQADGSILIETEAWEQRNGTANDVAMRTGVPGVLTGKQVMAMVWDIYLNNLGRAFTAGGGTFEYRAGTNGADGLWRELPAGSANPFQAGIPFYRAPYGGSGPHVYGGVHAGTRVPNGHYGPDYVPPAPRLSQSDVEIRRPLVLLDRMSTIRCHQPSCTQTGSFSLSLSGFEGFGSNAGRFNGTAMTNAERERLIQSLLGGGNARANEAIPAGLRRD